ncbi:class I SAM-dependent methyltransferase [Alteribacter natronophilus]|uniref:class I SAM-dependent methyltransferase n=1 Tax=Alteribacter natronophilus TaxID=2583810 RepID=UPI00110DE706|nr:class I SAM-dependent methyltransferase [Alteribacter natronophilus]TMW71052.1 class I SAM-dependent methyltransferase [Alteribacter natronophilus]
MNARVKETFDRLAHRYEHQVDSENVYNAEYERPAMMNQLPGSLHGKDVLDAGCAAGWYTEQLLERGASVTAADLSPEMVQAAKRRIGQKAEVLELDFSAPLPFKGESFDYVVCSLSLHYIRDWPPVFCEFSRVLKPGGVILYSVHHPTMDVGLSKSGDYFGHELIVDEWSTDQGPVRVPFYRRPLQMILNDTLDVFNLELLIEPQPTARFLDKNPEGYQKLMTRPNFLIVKGRKRDEISA